MGINCFKSNRKNEPRSKKPQILAQVPPPFRSLVVDRQHMNYCPVIEDMHHLVRLTYVSRPTRILNEVERSNLVSVSQRNNLRDEITGVLFISDSLYCQTLEGKKERILHLLALLYSDNRHTGLTITEMEYIDKRIYPNWSMERITMSPSNFFIVDKLLNSLVSSYEVLKVYTSNPVIDNITKVNKNLIILTNSSQGINPLTITPKKVKKAILFADIVSYTTIAETLGDPGEIFQLINTYLLICINAVRECGGELSKFIGDCVLASFPIERTNYAVHCAITIQNKLNELRKSAPPTYPESVLFSGIGIAVGDVLEGNLGAAEFKMEYTYIGNIVNVASRLEHVTRKFKVPILVTEQVKNLLSSNIEFAYVSSVNLRNLASEVGVYTPIQCFSDSDFSHAHTKVQNWKCNRLSSSNGKEGDLGSR